MEELVSLGKVLSDINRVRILALIQREKEMCVCEICDTLELSQPLVSRHLKQMKEAGFVSATKNGKWMVYSLSKNKNLSYLFKGIKEEILNLPQTVSCSKLLKSSLKAH